MSSSDASPPDAISMLSKRQKEVLRLLLLGHDAKSLSRLLNLSVHTVNEHLRDARRVLRVSSSREAARRLAAAEGLHPNFIGDREMGVEAAPSSIENTHAAGDHRALFYVAGVAIVIFVAVALYAGLSGNAGGTPQPRVVSVSPRAATTVRPGPFLLTVKYDRSMLDGSWSFVQVSPETFPQCAGQPTRGSDARTFSWKCIAYPGRKYEVWFNRQPYMNFKSSEGVPAEPYRLTFTTRAR